MYWFTADEHYGHLSIIKYCNRPFASIDEMDHELIKRFNERVSKEDVTIHAGDFCWCNSYKDAHQKYVSKLNGTHIFLVGSHDHWLPSSARMLIRRRIDGQLVTVCHYAMKTWPSSHYNSWHLYGHSHGKLEGQGKSFDIGVDGHDYRPWSWEEIVEEMQYRPDNFNLVRK